MASGTARFCALVALGTGLAFAQGSAATIMGTVKDVSGAVLQGAAVTVKHLETGLTRTDEADSSGNYSIPSLPVGAYEITAEKIGFRREVRRRIDLVVAQEAVVNLVLQVGSIEQQITVTEQAPLVNTTLSSTSGLVSESQIKDMRLNVRSFDKVPLDRFPALEVAPVWTVVHIRVAPRRPDRYSVAPGQTRRCCTYEQ